MKKFTTRSRLFKSSPTEFGMHGRSTKSWVYLGRLAEAGPLTEVRFDTGMAHVIGLFGKRGSGKSYTLGTLLEGLCTRETSTSISANPRTHAVLLFDTLGIFQWVNIALSEESRKETIQQQFAVRRGWVIQSEPLDVAIWIPKGSASDSTPSSHKEFTIRCSAFAAEDWGYLLGLNIYQDRMGQLLNDAFIKVTAEGWHDENTFHKATDSYSLSGLIKCVESDRDLTVTYATETRRALRQQLSTYERNPIFADNGTSLQDLLQPGRMSVIVMNKMSDELRLIVVAAFLRLLIASRIRASETEKHLKLLDNLSATEQAKLKATLKEAVPPTWVAIDEAQNILPSERATSATDVIVKYVTLDHIQFSAPQVSVSCRESGRVLRAFGAPPPLPWPATRSCHVRHSNQGALRQRVAHGITALPSSGVVVPVSGNGRVRPLPGPRSVYLSASQIWTTLRRSRGSADLHQRGHTSLVTLRPSRWGASCYGTTRPARPLTYHESLKRCPATAGYRNCQAARMSVSASQVLVSRREGGRVRQPSTFHRLTRARYGHPLRFYITPHFAKCAPVASLKLRLVPPTAARPCGFTKPTICKVPCAGVGRPAVGAPRSHPRPTRRRLVVPSFAWLLGISQCATRRVSVSGLRPGTTCVPRPPCWTSPLCGTGPSAPVGAPSAAPEAVASRTSRRHSLAP